MRYAAPTTVAEATSLLSGNPGSRVFAGATDLIPQMRGGRPEPTVLVDLKRIERLTAITRDDGGWTIGAATPTARLTADSEFAAAFPGLTEASGLIGSDQIQNRSSWGGNLCTASPAADSVPALVVDEVVAVIVGPGGERTLPVAEVPTGPGRTALADDEFIVEFVVPSPPAHTSDAYLRLTPRTEMDIAVVGAAVRVTLDGDTCTAATVALGAVAPTVVTVPAAAAALVGATVGAEGFDADVCEAVAAAAAAAADPIDDKRGTIAYRRRVAGVLAVRAANVAARRATA